MFQRDQQRIYEFVWMEKDEEHKYDLKNKIKKTTKKKKKKYVVFTGKRSFVWDVSAKINGGGILCRV